MTLFSQAADDNQGFIALLAKYYDGRQDELTLQRLGRV